VGPGHRPFATVGHHPNHRQPLIGAGRVDSIRLRTSVHTFAGSKTSGSSDTTTISGGELALPGGLALNASHTTLYVADFGNNSIRTVRVK